MIKNVTPLPDNVNIVKPDTNISLSHIPFSGEWYGMWQYNLPCRLIVESINENEANVIYSCSDHPNGYFKKGWSRAIATIDSTGMLSFELGDAKLNYRYDKNEDILIGNYKNQYADDRAIMKRKK